MGSTILLEGQLGALKDPDFGIYPMVTSSSTLAGYGAVGAGRASLCHPGRSSPWSRRIPAPWAPGEFVSEIFGEEADELRRRGGDGGEYGATTGRPRRMGWLDLGRDPLRLPGAGSHLHVAFTVLDASRLFG